MATMNVSLPDEMRVFVEERVNAGEYQSASDYIRDLIRHDHETIDQLLVDGLKSGEAAVLEMDYWQHKKRNLSAKS